MLSSGIVLHKAMIYGIIGMNCLLIGITEERRDMKAIRLKGTNTFAHKWRKEILEKSRMEIVPR